METQRNIPPTHTISLQKTKPSGLWKGHWKGEYTTPKQGQRPGSLSYIHQFSLLHCSQVFRLTSNTVLGCLFLPALTKALALSSHTSGCETASFRWACDETWNCGIRLSTQQNPTGQNLSLFNRQLTHLPLTQPISCLLLLISHTCTILHVHSAVESVLDW